MERTLNFTDRLAERMRQPDDAVAIAFEGREYDWGAVRRAGVQLEQLLVMAGVDAMQTIGILSRNRPGHAAAILNVIGSGRSVSIIYTMQSADGIARDIRKLGLPAVIGAVEDWSAEAIQAARETGTAAVSLAARDGLALELLPEASRADPALLSTTARPLTLALLSSGTTGAPKRIDFPHSVLDRMLDTMAVADQPGDVFMPEINFFPLSGMGGMTPFLASICRAGSVCLLERYNLAEWLDAIERFQPKVVVMLPAIIREVLDKQIPVSRFSSIKIVWGGSAPLDIATQEQFEERYGIPVLWGYGATEFAGSATAWTPALRAQFGNTKRGSAGRPLAGVSIRIVDPETGSELGRGKEGVLEARIAALGDHWIRTTDLAEMDEDDFLFLRGRADQAIIRGGFKVLPETITDALLEHPAVRDAMACGIEDRRLGQVPVAAVELKNGNSGATEEVLLAFLRSRLVTYAIPTRIDIVPKLPRTGNMKASIAALRHMMNV